MAFTPLWCDKTARHNLRLRQLNQPAAQWVMRMFGILPRELEIRHATNRTPAPAETETASPDRRIFKVSAQALHHGGDELFLGVYS